MYYIVLRTCIHISYRNAIMVDSMRPLDWELLNSDQKYEFCGKSVHRSVTDCRRTQGSVFPLVTLFATIRLS